MINAIQMKPDTYQAVYYKVAVQTHPIGLLKFLMSLKNVTLYFIFFELRPHRKEHTAAVCQTFK